jgi:hypothetical protein
MPPVLLRDQLAPGTRKKRSELVRQRTKRGGEFAQRFRLQRIFRKPDGNVQFQLAGQIFRDSPDFSPAFRLRFILDLLEINSPRIFVLLTAIFGVIAPAILAIFKFKFHRPEPEEVLLLVS